MIQKYYQLRSNQRSQHMKDGIESDLFGFLKPFGPLPVAGTQRQLQVAHSPWQHPHGAIPRVQNHLLQLREKRRGWSSLQPQLGREALRLRDQLAQVGTATEAGDQQEIAALRAHS